MKSEDNNVANQKGLYYIYKPDFFFFFSFDITRYLDIFLSVKNTNTSCVSATKPTNQKESVCILQCFFILFTKYHKEFAVEA